MKRIVGMLVAGTFALSALPSTAKAAETELRLATLAPERSPWGKVFRLWSKAVKKKSKGEVTLRWYWNGIAGPEKGVVGKMKSGQLAGAAMTANGLSRIYKPIIALQVPGVFNTWDELDKARDMLREDFDKALGAEGFTVTGWGDVGAARTFSYGFPVVLPNDLKGKSPLVIPDDTIGPKVLETIGGVSGKPGEITEILPLLRSHAINVLTSPPLAVEQLQWAPQLDHMNTGISGFGIGALVVSDAKLALLTPENKEAVLKSGKRAAKRLIKRIRKLDEKAYGRLLKKMTVHEQTEAERAEWKKVWGEACKKIKKSMPGDVLAKVGAC